MNLNITSFYNTWELSNDCINWCREQTIIHQENLTKEAMIIPVFAFTCLLCQYLIINHNELILKYTEITDKKLEKICIMASELAMYLLIGFFIWFIWFK